MTKLEFLIILLMVMILSFILGIFASEEANAAVPKPLPAIHRLAPPVPCTSKNRMDIFVDEDDILWACECQILVTINICRWQVIGGVESPAARRFLRLHPLSRMYFQRRGYTIPPMIARIP